MTALGAAGNRGGCVVHVEGGGGGADVGGDRRGPRPGDGGCRRDEGGRRDEDFVAWADAQGTQRNFERGRAAGGSDRRAGELGAQPRFEILGGAAPVLPPAALIMGCGR